MCSGKTSERSGGAGVVENYGTPPIAAPMEVNLTLKVNAAGNCDAHWSIYTETRGFVVTDRAHGALKGCLQAVRQSVNEQLELESAREIG